PGRRRPPHRHPLSHLHAVALLRAPAVDADRIRLEQGLHLRAGETERFTEEEVQPLTGARLRDDVLLDFGRHGSRAGWAAHSASASYASSAVWKRSSLSRRM